MEIARRISVPSQRGSLDIKTTSAAADYLRERFRGLGEEHFRVLYLNRRSALLEDALIAHGTVASVRPHLRPIIARALQLNASGMIAAHNHPSGMAEPSESDRLLTRDLMVAALPLGLRMLDHVIISEEGTFSFADSGLLGELSIEVGVVEEMVKSVKIIIEKHPDGYVAYPVGIKGVVVGEGDSYEGALRDVQSALKFHLGTFGPDWCSVSIPKIPR